MAEIAAAGKPAVFVPFPRAADDHQRVNAEALARHGAAVVVEESKLEGVWLAETIAALLQDPQRLRRMSDTARTLAHPNAASDIARMAAKVAGIEESQPRINADSRGSKKISPRPGEGFRLESSHKMDQGFGRSASVLLRALCGERFGRACVSSGTIRAQVARAPKNVLC